MTIQECVLMSPRRQLSTVDSIRFATKLASLWLTTFSTVHRELKVYFTARKMHDSSPDGSSPFTGFDLSDMWLENPCNTYAWHSRGILPIPTLPCSFPFPRYLPPIDSSASFLIPLASSPSRVAAQLPYISLHHSCSAHRRCLSASSRVSCTAHCEASTAWRTGS